MSEDVIQIRIDLKGKTKKMFEKVKEKYNLDTYTETMRLIIKIAHDSEFKES